VQVGHAMQFRGNRVSEFSRWRKREDEG
jgi:hypothetical protein